MSWHARPRPLAERRQGRGHGAARRVAQEELDWWVAKLGRQLPNGIFGENIATMGLDVDGALIGERWRIGDVILEVTGAYLAVVEAGTVRSGDAITVIRRPDHNVDVVTSFQAFRGNDDAVARVEAAGLPVEQ